MVCASVFSVIFITSSIALSLSLPLMLGHILSGFILHFLGILNPNSWISVVSEIGIVSLLFMAGLELSIDHFFSSLPSAFKYVFTHFFISFILTVFASFFIELNYQLIFLLSLLLTLSSTVVALKSLTMHDKECQQRGPMILSILLSQDLLFICGIVFFSIYNAQTSASTTSSYVSITILLTILYTLSSNQTSFIRKFWRNLVDLDFEYRLISAISLFFVFLYLFDSINLSIAMGAFTSGLFLGNLELKHNQMYHAMEPIIKLLAIFFFVYLGVLVPIDRLTFEYAINLLLASISLLTIKGSLHYILARVILKKQNSKILAILLTPCSELSFFIITILKNYMNLSTSLYLQDLILCSLILGAILTNITRRLLDHTTFAL